jgi:hypothetical protein
LASKAHYKPKRFHPAAKMPPTIHDQWVRRALTVILCLAATVLLWYGAGALFDHDPSGGYPTEQRLARWLLVAHDRMADDRVPLTHEHLALMLGVRRAGVTVALHSLEGEKLVRAGPGADAVPDWRDGAAPVIASARSRRRFASVLMTSGAWMI